MRNNPVHGQVAVTRRRPDSGGCRAVANLLEACAYNKRRSTALQRTTDKDDRLGRLFLEVPPPASKERHVRSKQKGDYATLEP